MSLFTFERDDCIQKDSIDLYKNLATCGELVGFLQSELQINPSPRINWRLEFLGNQAYHLERQNGKAKHPIIGHNFEIRDASIFSYGSSTLRHIEGFYYSGGTSEVWYGKETFLANQFVFFLPNTGFHRISHEEQTYISERLVEDEEKIVGESTWGRYIEFSLNENWSINLETTQESFNWLRNSFGTKLTTIGYLYSPQNNGNSDIRMSLAEARARLEKLSILLSFSNGGYTYPIIIQGIYNAERDISSAAVVSNYAVTPLEDIGHTWITHESSMTKYLSCFSTLEKMLEDDIWKKSIFIILAWYFQAIQPSHQFAGKPWPIISNALGAALERLCNVILVEELNIKYSNEEKRYLVPKIRRLLETIGIKNEMDHVIVEKFVALRNNATHPKQDSKVHPMEIGMILKRAILWVEEVILWRLGYKGKYLDRTTQDYHETLPRYDLSSRHSKW